MTKSLIKLFTTSRPISWLNTAYPFAATYFIISGKLDMIFWLGTLFFLIPYNLLMYGVNDVYDHESDIKNPRKNSIEGAVTDKNFHRVILQASLWLTAPFCIALLINGQLINNLILLLSLFFVLAYSVPHLRFKEKPFVDSITSALHFVTPMIYALSFFTWDSNYLYYIGAFFLWAMASHAFGAVQDIKPDKKAGIGSIAAVIGASRTVKFSISLYSLAALLLIGAGTQAFAMALCCLLYILNILPYASVSEDQAETSNAAWRRFIYLNYFTGFVLTLLLIVNELAWV